MISRETRLRFRRKFRKRQKEVAEFSSVTEDSLERYIFKRLVRLASVRRFVLGWAGLVVLLCIAVVLQARALSPLYQETVPLPGGAFREGIVGSFTNANPLYAQNEVDSSVSRLVFAGLLSYNTKGELVPDLAERYELDQTETIYTVHLKKDLRWHDGKPILAKDVVYTFSTAQNPESRSFLTSSWKGVTVKEVNDWTVTFQLANALSAFPQSLTIGILPEHILGQVPPAQLRSIAFNNQNPVGSGPFKFSAVETEGLTKQGSARIALDANPDYHRGVPKLDRFVFRTYPDEKSLTEAFKNAEVDTMVGLDMLPDDMPKNSYFAHGIPLTGQVMVFFRNSQEILSDPNVRRALVMGIDKQQVFEQLPYPVLSVDEPLLGNQIGYNKTFAQVTNKKAEASELLDKAGWVRNMDTQMRQKDGKPLKFNLYSSANSEFTAVSGNLREQWHDLGVEVKVELQSEEELQTTVSSHNYDSLMYGISIGQDPDVYAYWHGSQGDVRSETRLNLSEYKSPQADKALEAGRTRSDKQNRAVKYRPFLEAWKNDAPALALYQPRFFYVTSDNVSGFEYGVTHSSADRYSTVINWTVRSGQKNIVE